MTKLGLVRIKELIVECLDTYRDGYTHKEAAQAGVDCLREIEKIVDAELTGSNK
jgi:hypothetical protein